MLNLAVELNSAGVSARLRFYIAKASYAQMKMDLIERNDNLSIQEWKTGSHSRASQPGMSIQVEWIGNPQINCRTEDMGADFLLPQCRRADLMGKTG